MADDLKVYSQETIKDTAFPVESTSTTSTDVTSGGTAKVYTPNTISDQPMPKPLVAVELMSTTLNTRTQKILAQWGFTPSGAIQIGQYTNGVNGDIRISPDGIVARDMAGNTTFAIDGDTGNAVFKGEVRSGSILTGGVIIQDDAGQTVIDGSGLVSTSTFPNYNQIVPADSVGNVVQTITAETTYTTITNGVSPATHTITVPRQTKIYISGRADLFFYQAGTDGYGALGRLAIKIGNDIVDEAFFSGDRVTTPGGPTGYGLSCNSISINYVGTIPAGTTTIYLQAYKTSTDTTATELDIVSYSFNYFLLGT